MVNKINLITGETYTLSELFSGNRKIIIPDLQRDYCWADKIHTDAKIELVSNFVDTLLHQFESEGSEALSLGLIYGYEAPADHVQLCDGQQRITTLFLLIGMLNRQSENDRLKKYLISDFEYNHDDKEPYLQYSIRESSLYFLSDLVCKFFIDRGLSCVEAIASKDTQWYFEEYNQDPSIQSMIKALMIIEERLKECEKDWLSRFGDFLVNRLTFMYYDMENRSNGEETFVVINTTGESLSTAQNLKPLVLNAEINKEGIAENYSKWEEMETWFWNNRSEENGNNTADAGFEEFLRWVTIIEYANAKEAEAIKQLFTEGSYQFPFEKISFGRIYTYWECVKLIFEEYSNFSKEHVSPKTKLSQKDCFRLLPVLLYCCRFILTKSDDTTKIRIRRVDEFFKNLARYQDINVANQSVYHAIGAISSMEGDDLISLIDSTTVSEHILTEEEKTKLEILRDNPQRLDIEQEFWRMQEDEVCVNHKIWNGRLLPLIEWSTVSGTFDLQKFIAYSNLFDEVFVGNCVDIDLTRRALLTVGLKDYPRIFRGYTNWSFGWEYEDWRKLIRENKETFKLFFDTLLASDDIVKEQGRMIADFSDTSNWWNIFVKNAEYMGYCSQKKVQLVNQDIIILLSKAKASADYRVLYGGQEVHGKENWTHWRNDGSECVYTNHERYNVAIGLKVDLTERSEERFFLKLLKRGGSSKEAFDLDVIAKEHGLTLIEDGTYRSNNATAADCYALCERVRQGIV